MVKYKFPGKPPKFSHRKLVNVSNCTNVQENESARAAEIICFGLSVFNEAFGPDEEEIAPFHGFSPYDITKSEKISKSRLAEVEKEYANRGVPFEPIRSSAKLLPSSSSPATSTESLSKCVDDVGSAKGKQSNPPAKKKSSPVTSASTKTNSLSADVNCVTKKRLPTKKKLVCSNSLFGSADSILSNGAQKVSEHKNIFGQTGNSFTSSISKACLKNQDKGPTPTFRNSFTSQVPNARSLRGAKPNKRPRDSDNCSDGSSCSSDSSSDQIERTYKGIKLKKARLVLDPIHEDPGFTWSRSRDESLVVSDVESETSSLKSLSTASSSSSSGSDEPLPRPTPTKVILRKPRLNVDSLHSSYIARPKNSGALPGKVVCGVCGATRFYRFVKQAKKFGIYSCESCRKFISKMIIQSSSNKFALKCRGQKGQCTVPTVLRSYVGELLKKQINNMVRKMRCQACWLKTCVRCYCMPENLKIKLNRMLPQFMRDPILEAKKLKKPVKKFSERLRLDKNITDKEQQSKLSDKKENTQKKGLEGLAINKVHSDKQTKAVKGKINEPIGKDSKSSSKFSKVKSLKRLLKQKWKELQVNEDKEDDEDDDKIFSKFDEKLDKKNDNMKKKQVNKDVKPTQINKDKKDTPVVNSQSKPINTSDKADVTQKFKANKVMVDIGIEKEDTKEVKRNSSNATVPVSTVKVLPVIEEEIRKKRKAALNSLANIARFTGKVVDSSPVESQLQIARNLKNNKFPGRLSGPAVDNQLMVARNLKKKATAIARRENIADADTSRMKKKRTRGGKQANPERKFETNLVNFQGPRVKHVCRSVSMVLGKQLATFSDNTIVKVRPLSKDMPVVELAKPTNENTNILPVEISEPLRPRVETALTSSGRMRRCERGNSKETEDVMQQGKGKTLPHKTTYARTLQDLGRQNCELLDGVGSQPEDVTVSIDFWESYDPEEVCKTGFALIGSDPTFRVPSLCFLCGSAGVDKLIHCACCCEPYHQYCIEGGSIKELTDKSWWRVDWVCPRCTHCSICGYGDGSQVTCQKCQKSYHTDCLPRNRTRPHSWDRSWVCHSCLRCKSCNSEAITVFVGNIPLCNSCFKLRQKGSYCPLCQKCYDDNDFDTKMMECGRCKCWVHAKCEGLSNEKYEVLSFLPESVEFVCRLCCVNPPAPWWFAVESELKAGYLSVLKSLSKNKTACDLLKNSPKKQSPCVCRTPRHLSIAFPDLSEQSDPEFDQRIQREQLEKEELNDECLQKSSITTMSLPSENNKVENKLNDPSLVSEPKDKVVGAIDRIQMDRIKYNVKECSVQLKNCNPSEELHLKLGDSDPQLLPIPYQSLEGKGAQFSPHATSQSDSGIGSTDDELKPSFSGDDVELNGVKQCFCGSSEAWPKSSLTLMQIRKKVTSNGYSSLQQFHQDMQLIVKSLQTSSLLGFYYNTIKDVFPWFNPKSPPLCDAEKDLNESHSSIKEDDLMERKEIENKSLNYAEETEKSPLNGLLGYPKDYYYSGIKYIDNRICVLCKLVGDGLVDEEGRLLYCGHNEWIHANCALWSNEVFEEIDGSLQNVHSAISRSRLIRCANCGKRGATVGCCFRNCPESYHFPCARTGRCVFMEDKSIYCHLHFNESLSKPLNQDSDFAIKRPCYVELERKKKKFVPHHQVKVMIGSLYVENLGEFITDVSDQEMSILPGEFSCTRLFWSSVEPWRLVQYNIRTKIVHSNQEYLADNDTNFTVDHSLDKPSHSVKDDAEVKQLMEYVLDVVSKEDESDPQDPQNSADLLPPELTDAIFKDLPHDILDGISMQDIFPKMMSYDDIVLDKGEKVKSDDSDNSSDGLNKKTGLSSSMIRQKISTFEKELKHKFFKKKCDNKNSAVEVAKWKDSIPQIDGTIDYTSESDSGSPGNKESILHVTIKDSQNSVNKGVHSEDNIFKNILQVDGIMDSDSEPESSKMDDSESTCDSLDFISQLDGTADDSAAEEPVKCTRCHCTYRTAAGYDRHLSNCNTNYMLSSSESDSSEEEKTSSPVIHNNEPQIVETDTQVVEPSSDFCQSTEDVIEYVVETSENPDGVQESTCINSALYKDADSPVVNPDNNSYIIGNDTEVGSSDLVVYTQDNIDNCILINVNGDCKVDDSGNTYYVTKPAVDLKNRNISVINDKRKRLEESTTGICQQPQQIMQTTDYQAATTPTLILQQVPVQQNVIPTYVDAYQAPQQYIAIDSRDKATFPVQLSSPFQIQSTPVQTVVPTVLGTIIQPSGVEQLVLNSPQSSIDVFGQQSGGVYISNPQMFMNMETVVSNTVMSSSQFVSVPGSVPGMLSTYSATTTQVFQAAKPVIDVPQSYIVVNTSPAVGTVVNNSVHTTERINVIQQQQTGHQVQHVPNWTSQYPDYKAKPVSVNQVKLNSPSEKTVVFEHRNKSSPVKSAPVQRLTKMVEGFQGKKFINNTIQAKKFLAINNAVPKQKPPELRVKPIPQQKLNIPAQRIWDMNEKIKKITSESPPKNVIVDSPKKNLDFNPKFKKVPVEVINCYTNKLKNPENPKFKVVKAYKIQENNIVKSASNIDSQSDTVEVTCIKTSENTYQILNAVQNGNSLKSSLTPESDNSVNDVNMIQEVENYIIKTVDQEIKPISTAETTNKFFTSRPVEKSVDNKLRTYTVKKKVVSPISNAGGGSSTTSQVFDIYKFTDQEDRILQPTMKENVYKIFNKTKQKIEEKLQKEMENKIHINSVANTVVKEKVLNGDKKEKPTSSPKNGIKMTAAEEIIMKFGRDKNLKTKKPAAPKVMYEINSNDGFSCSSQSLYEAWQKVFDAVQEARAAKKLPPLPLNTFQKPNSHMKALGLNNNSVKYVLEQLPGVAKCVKYKPTYHKPKRDIRDNECMENPSGCIRCEPFMARNKYDMFSWLASRHRRPPKLLATSETDIVNGNSRRATSLNLPMAMRFRHLRETSKEAVGVFRSDIHGRGLFCLRDIDAGEMVIEYAGEVIRSALTDKRERYYTSKGIGCYMFRIDDNFVVDATMKGNAARFINHSCEPNCYSRVVDILGKKHILIFALRRITQGEELTYDYKFPLEDDKISCHCLSRKCRKYLN